MIMSAGYNEMSLVVSKEAFKSTLLISGITFDFYFFCRTRVLQRLIAFLKSQPSDLRIYIGLRRLGKESALVQFHFFLDFSS